VPAQTESKAKAAVATVENDTPTAPSPSPGSLKNDTEAEASKIPGNVAFIRDIPVHIVVELGRTKMNIKDILGLGKGSAIVLSNLEGETLDIRANNRLIAKGEVLVENDKYGIRIREIVGAMERVESLTV